MRGIDSKGKKTCIRLCPRLLDAFPRFKHRHQQARPRLAVAFVGGGVHFEPLVARHVDAPQREQVLRAQQRVRQRPVRLVDERRARLGGRLGGAGRVHVWVRARLELQELAAQLAHVNGEVAARRRAQGQRGREERVVAVVEEGSEVSAPSAAACWEEKRRRGGDDDDDDGERLVVFAGRRGLRRRERMVVVVAAAVLVLAWRAGGRRVSDADEEKWRRAHRREGADAPRNTAAAARMLAGIMYTLFCFPLNKKPSAVVVTKTLPVRCICVREE
ncbi:hypothetical protein BM221_008055 [Beauveria bassiana]|uniref:Uncharacterized protein n=1 Tax=Beauveria bassiana TaxID=176275 RepID=A0A2N6NF11_BEABA|nr:hypothetical protein BM221_008055 [Beauveria bassiana]